MNYYRIFGSFAILFIKYKMNMIIYHLFALGLTQNTHSRANQEVLRNRMPIYPFSLFLVFVN